MTGTTYTRGRLIGEWVATVAAVTAAVAGAVAAIVFAVMRWSEIQRLDFRYVQNIGAGLGHANEIVLAAIGLLAAILFGVTAARGLFLLAAQLVLTSAAAATFELLLFTWLMNVWSTTWAVRGSMRARELFLSDASVLPQGAHLWWLLLFAVMCFSALGIALLRTRVLRWR